MILEYSFDEKSVFPFEINQAQKIEALTEIIARYYGKEKYEENKKLIAKLFEDGFMADDDELAEQYEMELLEYFEDEAREENNECDAREEIDDYYRWRNV